ncbi:hypothetical protein ACLB2K_013580 [Fragaria x ananassa]
MHKPTQIHFGIAKRVLRYIQGSIEYGIMFERNVVPKLYGFCDNDWGGNVDDSKSTSGYAFTLGTSVFSWQSKKKKTFALSTAEAEYVSASLATSQAIWLRSIMEDIGEKTEDQVADIFITKALPKDKFDYSENYWESRSKALRGSVKLMQVMSNSQTWQWLWWTLWYMSRWYHYFSMLQFSTLHLLTAVGGDGDDNVSMHECTDWKGNEVDDEGLKVFMTEKARVEDGLWGPSRVVYKIDTKIIQRTRKFNGEMAGWAARGEMEGEMAGCAAHPGALNRLSNR